MEPDAPAAMRRLWSVLGDSHATAKYRPVRREESRETFARVFADWFAEPISRNVWSVDDSPEAYFTALPARYRLAFRSSNPGDEIEFMDETEDVDDPPVLVMRKAEPPIIAEARSYVEWLVWRLLSEVSWSRYTKYYKQHSGIQGERILPSLYPQLERLGDGVYWMRIYDYLRTDAIPVDQSMLFYRTLEDYFRWLLTLSDEHLPVAQAPKRAMKFVVSSPGAWDVTRGVPDGFRRFRLVDGSGTLNNYNWRAVGRIGDVYLWLDTWGGDELTVYVDPRRQAEAREILRAHNLRIERVERPPAGYGEYGW